jgi:excisionase family DNA binding protein
VVVAGRIELKRKYITSEEGEKYGEKDKSQNGNADGGAAGEVGRFVVESEAGRKFFENRFAREWLSTDEAAHFLSVSPNALRIMVYRGQIEAYRLGRRLRFSVRDCQALFRKRGA